MRWMKEEFCGKPWENRVSIYLFCVLLGYRNWQRQDSVSENSATTSWNRVNSAHPCHLWNVAQHSTPRVLCASQQWSERSGSRFPLGGCCGWVSEPGKSVSHLQIFGILGLYDLWWPLTDNTKKGGNMFRNVNSSNLHSSLMWGSTNKCIFR